MNEQDRKEMLEDASSEIRRSNFESGAAKSRAWEREHRRSLDDYLELLDSVQQLFGPFPVDRKPWAGEYFRL